MILSETYEKSSIESVISFLISNPTPFLFNLFCPLYRNVCPLSHTVYPYYTFFKTVSDFVILHNKTKLET